MTIRSISGLTCILILLLGCPSDDDDATDDDASDDDTGDDDTGDDDTGDDDTGDDDTGDDDVAFTPGGCGAPEYQWLPPDDMGEIVAWEDGGTFSAMEIAYAETLGGLTFGTPPVHDVHLYVIRYVTQDRGVAVEATGMLVFPVLAKQAEVPTLLYHHGTVGYNDGCAPSAEGPDNPENVYAASHAARGFAVAAPDYLGMNGLGAPSKQVHPYVISEPTAVASLDALRALQRFQAGEGDKGLLAVPGDTTVLLGISQGGTAVLSTERYAPHYAPELDVVAAAAHAPNPESIDYFDDALANPTHDSGAGIPWFAAAWDWYGQQGTLDEVFTDDPPVSLASTLVGSMSSGCDISQFWDMELSAVMQPDIAKAIQADDMASIQPWGCYLEQATLSRSPVPRTSDTPVLFQVSGQDNVCFPAGQQAAFELLCSQGYEMNYLECAGLDHVDGIVASIESVHAWILDRVDGVPLSDPCVVTAPVDCAPK